MSQTSNTAPAKLNRLSMLVPPSQIRHPAMNRGPDHHVDQNREPVLGAIDPAIEAEKQRRPVHERLPRLLRAAAIMSRK
jgi:hypothetical protein